MVWMEKKGREKSEKDNKSKNGMNGSLFYAQFTRKQFKRKYSYSSLS